MKEVEGAGSLSRVEAPEKDPAVDLILKDPKIDSYTSIEFALPEYEGRELTPGRRIEFHVPKEFQGRIVRDVILHHRKADKYAKDIKYSKTTGEVEWDPNGAYTRVEVFDKQDEVWKQWSDPMGYNSDKFAELRGSGNPEVENLHDWIATVGKLHANRVRVTNVGKHPTLSTVQIHKLEVNFFPELEGVTYEDRIYCKGTSFVDIENEKLLPTYGGGEHTSGKYVGAIRLGGYGGGSGLFKLGDDPGEGARVESNRLIYKLEAGKKLAQVEVSVGDTEYYGATRGGKNTRLGWAKLWVGIKRAATEGTEWFIKNANIPPQGVISGAPLEELSDIKTGDEIVIESRADTAYVMGWRVAYKDKDKKVDDKDE